MTPQERLAGWLRDRRITADVVVEVVEMARDDAVAAERLRLREYIDQLDAPTPVGYGDDPKQSFEAGFGWAMDAVDDYLDGKPWLGGKPWMSHGADGLPLPEWRPPRAEP